jgi:hypothetical protein
VHYGPRDLTGNLISDFGRLSLNCVEAVVGMLLGCILLLKDDLLVGRKPHLHVTADADRQLVVDGATHEVSADSPHPGQDGKSKGDKKRRHKEQHGDANPEERKGEGACGGEGDRGQEEADEDQDREEGEEDLNGDEELEMKVEVSVQH